MLKLFLLSLINSSHFKSLTEANSGKNLRKKTNRSDYTMHLCCKVKQEDTPTLKSCRNCSQKMEPGQKEHGLQYN